MKLYLFPPSARVLAILALRNHLALDCELNPIDLGRGDQLTPEYLALNPDRKMPTLTDGEFVLWESNAILFYMASKRPESGLWPSDPARPGRRAALARLGKRTLGCRILWHGRVREITA